MTTPTTHTITVPSELIDVIASYHGVGSVEVGGVASCVVRNEATGAVVLFESPRVPEQRVGGDGS